MKCLPALLVGASLFASSTSAATINVPAVQPTIQAAIVAASNGDTVLVAPGTYIEKLNFLGKAITVKSSGGAAVTILDGNNSGPIVDFVNNETTASVLQGFTLTHAVNPGTGGGAVNVLRASPTIEDNVFTANTSTAPGSGAALTTQFSSAVIIRNYFVGNDGGTGYPTVIVGSTDPVVADNVFANNIGVALMLTTVPGDNPEIYNNTLVGNTKALYLVSVPSGPGIVSNNLVAFNQTGAELYFSGGSQYFSNNLVYGNTVANYQFYDQTGGSGNVSADPQLKDWATGDVHLLGGSAAIAAGDGAFAQVSATDFYGAPRVIAGSAVVDIGAAAFSAPVLTAVAGSVSAPTVSDSPVVTGTLGRSGTYSGESLRFAVITQSTHGTVIITDPPMGAFEYLPDWGYFGTDSFTFHAIDPYGIWSNTATEQVTALPPAVITTKGGSISVPADATSTDTSTHGTLSASGGYSGESSEFVIVTKPAHGTALITDSLNGTFDYVPSIGYTGTDSFTFRVLDPWGVASNTSTEQVKVTGTPTKSGGGALDLLSAGILSWLYRRRKVGEFRRGLAPKLAGR